jgi:hypothetical protein
MTNGISTTGLALSPVLTDIDVNHYLFLTGQAYGYSMR